MLKAKALPALLSQINTDGVETTMLFSDDGALLGTAGSSDVANRVEPKVVAAIMANVWTDFERAGQSTLQAPRKQSLDCLLIEVAQIRVAATKVADKYVLCACGSGAELGLLRLKARAGVAAPTASMHCRRCVCSSLH